MATGSRSFKYCAPKPRHAPSWPAMRILSFIAMCAALILEGAYLWVRDALTRNIPSDFIFSDIVWTAALVSLVFYKRWPWVTVAAWALFLTSAVILEPYSFGHGVSAFLGRNLPVLTNLVFAHVGLHFRRAAA